MIKLRSRAAASTAVFAALSMTATPVLARGGDDWWRSRHHQHDSRTDGGAILAGLLIVGGAAVIASAVTKTSQEGQPEEPDHYPGGPDDGASNEGDYSQAPEEPDNGDAIGEEGDGTVPDSGYSDDAYPRNGFGAAVDRCLDELDRGQNRIDTIDSVRHSGDIYDVEGRLADGRGFACSIDEEGQVRSIDINGHAMI